MEAESHASDHEPLLTSTGASPLPDKRVIYTVIYTHLSLRRTSAHNNINFKTLPDGLSRAGSDRLLVLLL
jgi:hypothetical protein